MNNQLIRLSGYQGLEVRGSGTLTPAPSFVPETKFPDHLVPDFLITGYPVILHVSDGKLSASQTITITVVKK